MSIRPMKAPPEDVVRPLVMAYGRTNGPRSPSGQPSLGADTADHPAAGSWALSRGRVPRYLPIRRTIMAIS
jgi:hypothetical protein